MLSPSDIVAKKQKGEKVSMITAYDYAFARMAEEAGVDQILVGDSLANTMLGYKSTREIGMTEMLIFASAVCRGAPNTHVIGDMPYLSDKDPQTAYDNARRFMDVGCASIKLEGTPEGVIEFLRSKDIPVCAHHGLLPQTAENFKQKGRTAEEAAAIEAAAKFTDSLGCFEMVLEDYRQCEGCHNRNRRRKIYKRTRARDARRSRHASGKNSSLRNQICRHVFAWRRRIQEVRRQRERRSLIY